MGPRLSAAVSAFLLAILVACSGGTEPGGPATRVAFVVVPCVQVADQCVDALAIGESHQLTATALDSANNPIEDAVITWSSTDPSVLEVTATGTITAIAPGSAAAIATSDTASGGLAFTVLAPVGSVTLSPATNGIVPGGTYTVQMTLRDASGNELGFRRPTWISADPAIAEVDADGLITGKAPGIASITATREGVSGSTTIEVERITLVSFASNRVHSCGLTAAGRAWCWGLDESGQLGYGQLGFGTTPYGSTPRLVAGGLTFASVSPGAHHTCGLTTAGAAWCWGSNAYGQLGTSTVEHAVVPVAVSGGHTFASISSGNAYTCALTGSGEAWCWGRNHVGQLGVGDLATRFEPTAVLTSLRFSWIGGKRDFGDDGATCALDLDGKAYCWGSNSSGGLGDGGVVTVSSVPHAVAGGLTFTQLSTMSTHSCGVTTSGDAYCWGSRPGTSTIAASPVLVPGGLSWTAMTVAVEHDCGLVQSGAVYCWGYNAHGQFGDGTASTITEVPVPGALGMTFTTITGGDAYTCGLAADGQAYCWGEGNDGSLGTGDASTRLVPTPVAGQQ